MWYIWFKTSEGLKESVRIDTEYSEALIKLMEHVGEDFSKIVEVEVCTVRELISQAVDLEFAIMAKVKEMRSK